MMRIDELAKTAAVETKRKQTPERTDRLAFQKKIAEKLQEKDKELNIWQELANRYNVENTSFENMSQIAKSLYDAGEISLQDVMTMTFDYGRATEDLKNCIQDIPSQFSMFETMPDSFGNLNWLFEFEARAQKNFNYGNLLSYQNNMRILDILKQIHHAKQGD